MKAVPDGAIHLRDVTLGYDRHPAVHHLDGVFKLGSLTAIVGPNGAGKSTLLKGIAGALKPLSGAITFGMAKGERVAYLPQVAEIDRSFPLNVEDLVAMGLWHRSGFFRGLDAKDRDAIVSALEAVGLSGFERRAIGTLSGGQMQRALFARLLLQDARIILLDEPLTAVDTKTAHDLLALVRRWHKEQRTVIAVLHDMAIVREVFPETLLMAREPIAWGATREVLSETHLAAARHMIEAYVPHAHTCERAA